MEESGSAGCTTSDLTDFPISGDGGEGLQAGINIDAYSDVEVFVQGGVLGPVGFHGAHTASVAAYGASLSGSMLADNYYSGSFSYELSFLDKDHTLILDLDKDAELFDGIGEKGLVLVPEFLEEDIKKNIEPYSKQK